MYIYTSFLPEYSDEELDDLEVKGYDLSTAGPKASIVPGQVYHVTLEKTQGSLGLNVTVSPDTCAFAIFVVA